MRFMILQGRIKPSRWNIATDLLLPIITMRQKNFWFTPAGYAQWLPELKYSYASSSC